MRGVLVLMLGWAAGALLAGRAAAQPQVPATFYGSVTVDGRPVPDGTEVLAFVDGKDCTQRGPSYRGTITVEGVSAYSIAVVHESQVPGCGAPGKTVTFTIAGRPARQTAVWQFGPQHVDLSAGAGDPIPLPTPTPTPPSPPAGGASPGTTVTSPSPLPTDDAAPRPSVAGAGGQRTPSAAHTPRGESKAEPAHEGGGAWPWVAAGAALAAAGASALGWRLARRRR